MKWAAKKGIQYKVEFKKKRPAVKWNSIDDKVRSGSNFAKYIMREVRKELGDDGYAVKRIFHKGSWYIIVKKNELLTNFMVPFMRRGKYEVFVSELCNRLVESYKHIDEKWGWAALKTSGRGFIK